MYFSPAYLSALIVRPLRYFYENYGPPDLKWTNDPKTSLIEIDTINNFNKIPIQNKPRILVSRGQYSVAPTGLTDNMAQADSVFASKGIRHSRNMVLIQGVAQIMLEARNEGTVERLVEMTQHFLSWTSPMIADAHGFKNFAQTLNVSTCNPSRDDTEIFACTINIPWIREEQWKVDGKDDVKIKNFLMTITP